MPQKCPQAKSYFCHTNCLFFDKRTRLRFFGFVFGDLTASLWVATPPVVIPPIATSSFFFFVLPKIFFMDLEMPIFYSLNYQRPPFSIFLSAISSVRFFCPAIFFLSNFISQQIFESLFIKSLNIKITKSLFLKIYKTFLIDKK